MNDNTLKLVLTDHWFEKMFCTSLREIELIGNIHENKELLNG